MNNNLIFFLSGALIVVLSVAVLSTGVVINKIIGVDSGWFPSHLSPAGSSFSFSSSDWATLNCQLLDDKYKELEEKWEKEDDADSKKQKKKTLDYFGQVLNSCNRRKAFYGLEYSALIIDICAGFICSVLGLLHYLNEGKSFSTKSGLSFKFLFRSKSCRAVAMFFSHSSFRKSQFFWLVQDVFCVVSSA